MGQSRRPCAPASDSPTSSFLSPLAQLPSVLVSSRIPWPTLPPAAGPGHCYRRYGPKKKQRPTYIPTLLSLLPAPCSFQPFTQPSSSPLVPASLSSVAPRVISLVSLVLSPPTSRFPWSSSFFSLVLLQSIPGQHPLCPCPGSTSDLILDLLLLRLSPPLSAAAPEPARLQLASPRPDPAALALGQAPIASTPRPARAARRSPPGPLRCRASDPRR